MDNSPANTTVLLIDDEEALLDVLGTALTDAGYNCLRASAAMASVEIARQNTRDRRGGQ